MNEEPRHPTTTPRPAPRRDTADDIALDPTPIRFAQAAGGKWLEWAVVEVDAHLVPGARASRCLIFTRSDCIRRVWDYPADWRTLDATALSALSWGR